tara:strand:- start:5192 stop:5860 length:669 start_codon:yes stop_codon:yes gene_type:complete
MLNNYLIKRFFYYFYGEKFFKRFDYNWSKYPSRYEIIQKLIDKKKYENYLEIGCDKDSNFSKIKVKNKIGVDPKSGGNIKMTSDDFFIQNKKFYDCIFIDGLHIYEQVRKDILNSIKFLNSNGVILVHDCLPIKIWNQIVPKIYGHWNGDVWKAIVEARTMKNIDTYTCIADHGLGVIFKRENRNLLDLNIKNFKKLKFKDYYINHKKFMNIIEANEIDGLL